MLLLWAALTIGFYCTFTLLVQKLNRCFVRGCPRGAEPDRLWCSEHGGLIHEESRRVGQTAESSSAHSLSDVPSTRDRTPDPHNPPGTRYSSPAGLRLTRRPDPPPRLRLVRPFDQEETL